MSQELRESLTDWLIVVSEAERQVEVTRQVLVENRSFDKARCFARVALTNGKNIGRDDLKAFLDSSRIPLSLDELDLLFEGLDRDRDGVVSPPEFWYSVCSRECSFVGECKTELKVTLEVEHSLSRVLEQEVKVQKAIERAKRELNLVPGFSVTGCFDLLDKKGKGFIEVRDIYDFIAQNNSMISYTRAERTLKRLNLGSSGRISPEEFKIAMTPRALSHETLRSRSPGNSRVFKSVVVDLDTVPSRSYLSSSKKLRSDYNTRALTPIKKEIFYSNNERGEPIMKEYFTYIEDGVKVTKESVLTYSNLQEDLFEPRRSYVTEYQTPSKVVIIPELKLSSTAKKSVVEDDDQNSPRFSALTESERLEMMSILRTYFSNIRAVEEARTVLALKYDFVPGEFFKLVDKEQFGLIKPKELEGLLTLLKVGHKHDDIRRLVKLFDKDNDGFLDRTELASMLLPADEECRHTLLNRASANISQLQHYQAETARAISLLFHALIENERFFEEVKKSIRTRVFTFFNFMDREAGGKVGQRELIAFLSYNNLEVTKNEAKLFIERFDSNLDGKVSFDEFMNEIRITN